MVTLMKIKTFAIISLFLLLLFISACGEGKKEQLPVVGQQNNTTSESDVKVDIVEPPQKVDLSTVKKVKIEDAGINVEIADTPDERRIGLMNRDELPADSGMIFVFEDEKVVHFWMKNTSIPLDIIHFNSDLEIVNILNNTSPCPRTQRLCPAYSSEVPVKYTLEVNAG